MRTTTFSFIASVGLAITQVVTAAAMVVKDISQCPALPPRTSPPASIHDLRPDDIKVVMGMGDSVMAGYGAKVTSIGKFFNFRAIDENRGVSFPMGGEKGAITVPNMFKHYSKDLIGASEGDHWLELCYGPVCPPYQHRKTDYLNAAQTGAMVVNLPPQVDYLVKKLKEMPDVDFQNDYKLLTLWIGNNDQCLGCLADSMLSPDNYEATIRKVLDNVHTRIPKTFVHLLSNFNITDIHEATKSQPWCSALRGVGGVFECTCGFAPGDVGEKWRAKSNALSLEYNKRLMRIAEEYKAKNLDDFAVVVDPGMAGVKLAGASFDNFSKFDCFHPSVTAHAKFGVGLWNNLLKPQATKSKGYAVDEPSAWDIECATEESRLLTH